MFFIFLFFNSQLISHRWAKTFSNSFRVLFLSATSDQTSRCAFRSNKITKFETELFSFVTLTIFHHSSNQAPYTSAARGASHRCPPLGCKVLFLTLRDAMRLPDSEAIYLQNYCGSFQKLPCTTQVQKYVCGPTTSS